MSIFVDGVLIFLAFVLFAPDDTYSRICWQIVYFVLDIVVL